MLFYMNAPFVPCIPFMFVSRPLSGPHQACPFFVPFSF
jgi:hypothetical protein